MTLAINNGLNCTATMASPLARIWCEWAQKLRKQKKNLS